MLYPVELRALKTRESLYPQFMALYAKLAVYPAFQQVHCRLYNRCPAGHAQHWESRSNSGRYTCLPLPGTHYGQMNAGGPATRANRRYRLQDRN